MRQKYVSHDIYCPEPADLANKLRAMAQWDYSWTTVNDQMEIQLDLSRSIPIPLQDILEEWE